MIDEMQTQRKHTGQIPNIHSRLVALHFHFIWGSGVPAQGMSWVLSYAQFLFKNSLSLPTTANIWSNTVLNIVLPQVPSLCKCKWMWSFLHYFIKSITVMFYAMIQDGKSIRIMRKTFNITAGIQLRNTRMKLTIKNAHLEYADSFTDSPLPCFWERSLTVTR